MLAASTGLRQQGKPIASSMKMDRAVPQSLINPAMVELSPVDEQTEQLARVTFAPSAVRYVKLGRGGRWVEEALDQGIIPFGYPEIEHPVCMKGDWAQVRQQLE